MGLSRLVADLASLSFHFYLSVPLIKIKATNLFLRIEFFNILLKDDLSWQPGTKAAYSDTAYILLGYALENITGKAYEEIVRGKITQPLGLNNTGFETPELGRGAIPAGMQWFDVNVGNYKSCVFVFPLLSLLPAVLDTNKIL
jgi:CubicO group peptidase (beta-lactamase class C family)